MPASMSTQVHSEKRADGCCGHDPESCLYVQNCFKVLRLVKQKTLTALLEIFQSLTVPLMMRRRSTPLMWSMQRRRVGRAPPGDRTVLHSLQGSCEFQHNTVWPA